MSAATILRGVTSGSSAGATTNSQVVVTAPAGVVSGDPLSVFIALRTAMGAAASAPAGWTLQNTPGGSSAGEGYLYTAKYGTDVTGTSWTFNAADAATANRIAWECIALNGSQVGAIHVVSSGQRPASAATLAMTMTTTASSYIVALGGDRAAGSSWTWPAGWVEEVDATTVGTNSASVTAAIFDTTPTPASTYAVTATASSATANGWWGMVSYVAAGLTNLNDIKAGSATPTLYVGATAVSKAYVGSVQVYP